MKPKRALSFFLLFAIFFLLITPIRSEASMTTNQKAVKSQITKYLNGIKKQDYKAIEKVMTSNAKKSLYRSDKQVEKVISKIQKKWFSYSIKNIKVSGKQATATIKVKYYDAYDHYIYSFEHLIKDVRKDKKITSSRVFKLWAKYLLQCYNQEMYERPDPKDYAVEEDLEPGEESVYQEAYDTWALCFNTKTVKINLIKEKGQWKISKNTKAMQDMTDCRVHSAHNYILKNIDDYKNYFILGF